MNMKLKAMLLGLSIMTALPVCAQKPVYLDTNKPIEERAKENGQFPYISPSKNDGQ